MKFLSTPSARRATLLLAAILQILPISIHALREEGDWRAQSTASRPRISIHALREEGDGSPGWLVLRQLISIHALREQGDNLPAVFKAFSKDFYMNFKGTFTYAHNEITKYDEAPKYAFQSKVGQSANVSQGYLSNGLFLDEAEIDRYNQQMGSTLGAGDIKYLNVSNMHGYGDDIVDVDDWTWIGNPTVPEIVYGFGPSFKYKNWDFSFFFQGVAKTSLFMSGFHPFGDNSLRNVLQFVANDRWSPTNQNVDAKYPRLTRKTSLNNTNPGNSGRTSDYWMRDGSFLKLKNMELGYTFKRMRFYISGSNLLTFSKFDLWDPEQGGGSGLKYPTQRVFNVGFQMTFNN